MNVLEEAILATDLAVYFRKREAFFDLINSGNYEWTNEVHRALLRSMLMTCCDIAAITKPWYNRERPFNVSIFQSIVFLFTNREIQKVVAELVASEFFQQGDIEKAQLNIEPIVSDTLECH